MSGYVLLRQVLTSEDVEFAKSAISNQVDYYKIREFVESMLKIVDKNVEWKTKYGDYELRQSLKS